jgi:YajG family uncharacterized lipoprotein
MWVARDFRCALSLLLGIFCGGLVSACAFTDRHVNLAPAMMPQIVSSSSVPQDGKVVSVARPQDLRPDPTTVGNIRNGYGIVTAQVRSNNDVAMWVANSLISGIEQAGYRVERAETVETAHTPLAIDIEVSRVFTEYAPNFFTIDGKADVAARVEVYRRGQRILRRLYTGKYENTNFVVATSAGEYQELLDAAMKDFLQRAVPDLTSSLGKATEDGRPE